MKKVFFPNLNGVRFFAAIMVVIHHVEQLKQIFGYPHSNSKAIDLMGGLGVTLFFVLSGFLITYLLILEKEENKTVKIFDFYLRRVLRIWPLYFLILVLAFFILPYIDIINMPGYSESLKFDFSAKLILYLLFLPNACLLLYQIVPYASQSWSIGVEEQFYFVWPLIIKLCKNVVIPMFTIIVVVNSIKYLAYFNYFVPYVGDRINTFIYSFLDLTRIDNMAIGGLGAYIVYRNNSILKIIYNKFFQITLYAVIVYLFVAGIQFKYFHNQIYAVVYCFIIINLACNTNTVLSINGKIFDYLGKISYGIYMYHPLCIAISLVVTKYIVSYAPMSLFSMLVMIEVLSILFTIAVSAASYRFFEEFFIKKKVSFSTIISGENAKNQGAA